MGRLIRQPPIRGVRPLSWDHDKAPLYSALRAGIGVRIQPKK